VSAILELTAQLIRRASLTPDDAGCQARLAARLAQAGFAIEHLGHAGVDNLWATHGGGAPVLVFLGHTDVVPSGPVAGWASPPFEPTERDGRLYGRGAADMKSGVAAMTLALERFVAEAPDHPGTVALLLTSDEEGIAEHGVRRIAAEFRQRGQRIDWCVVGEPSSRERLGDLVRVGRRGSLTGRLAVRGVQGHVAYPELALNPIHAALPALAELAATRWDAGDDAFAPTSFQISNLVAGTGADNVIPGRLEAVFNFRNGRASSAAGLRERVESTLHRHGLDFDLDWRLSGEPFLAPEGALRAAISATVRDVCGIEAQADTGGGTSDGRFIAPLGAEVVEIGPVNASIHKIDEYITLDDLERLPELYLGIARRLLHAGSTAAPRTGSGATASGSPVA
jgi:succinyl-diaminopimelate desuccinylase